MTCPQCGLSRAHTLFHQTVCYCIRRCRDHDGPDADDQLAALLRALHLWSLLVPPDQLAAALFSVANRDAEMTFLRTTVGPVRELVERAAWLRLEQAGFAVDPATNRVCCLPEQLPIMPIDAPHPVNVYWSVRNLTRVVLDAVPLQAVPPSLEACTDMRHVSLVRCGLLQLPFWPAEWARLETLNVAQNHLDLFPKMLPLLFRLRVLILAHNRIAFIPDDIANLHRLEWLDASYNQLVHFPLVGQMAQLHTLTLAHNCISMVDEHALVALPKFTQLDISHNPDFVPAGLLRVSPRIRCIETPPPDSPGRLASHIVCPVLERLPSETAL